MIHEEYFASYGDLRIHHEMLLDVSRTRTYRDAINHCGKAWETGNVVVMDVGAEIKSLCGDMEMDRQPSTLI